MIPDAITDGGRRGGKLLACTKPGLGRDLVAESESAGPGQVRRGKVQLSASLFSQSTAPVSIFTSEISHKLGLNSAFKYSLQFGGCRLLYLSHHALSSCPSSPCNCKQVFFLYPKDSVLLLMLCDKSALIHSQLIYVYSTSKWFNTSSNDLHISNLLMPEKAPAEVYGSRTIKSTMEQYIIAGDYMLETTDLSRTK